MEKLWHVQKLKDGTYGDWREFKENKGGIIFMGDKIIGWDYGTEDYNCMVYGYFNEKGEYVIDRAGYSKNKGVKMRTFIVRDSRSGKDRKVKGSDIPMPSVMLRVGDHINSEEFIVKIIDKEVKKMNNMNYKDTMTYQVAMNDFDEMCRVNYNKMIKKLMKDPLIKRIVNELNEKEVKKMKYFVTKVVKVKKEIERKQGECKEYVPLWCGECSRIPKSKKGTWVNNENLDKIKFPCFCSYVWSKRQYGILAAGFPIDKREYFLHDINEQDSCSTIGRSDSLKKLIEKYDIHILKGKVIIYDDNMEDKYSDD